MWKKGIIVRGNVGRPISPNALLRANLATDKIDAIVCATRHVAQYFIGHDFIGTTCNEAHKTVRAL